MGKLYPDGVRSHEQLRDLVWTFAMGWIEGLHSTILDNAGDIMQFNQDYAFLADENWWPDHTWDWTM